MLQLIQSRHCRRLKTTSSLVAIMLATPVAVGAANAADAQPAQPVPEEIVVTGSRIIRDGYEAPTPVTVVGIEQLQESAKPNIADTLNQMPIFQGSNTPASTGIGNGGTSGGNNLNLRNLGTNRTLVLFDGRRLPSSSADGVVDINLIPDTLISRVDVVTGGASAVYGSDALAGVVNFVLDTEFQGVKGSVMGGVTQRGDGQQYKINLAAGTSFAGGRGHFVIEGLHDRQDGVDGDQREWNMRGWYFIQNPNRTATNGEPQLILRDRVGLSQAYPGGIIVSGPLKGVAFGPNGQPFNYNYGDFVSGIYNVGGDWAKSSEMGGQSIMIESNGTKVFSKLAYDVTDNFQVFAQFNTGEVKTDARCCYVYHHGNLTVRTDNAFIPEPIRAQLVAAGVTQFAFGKTIRDNPEGFGMTNDRLAFIYTAGANGKFEAAETTWNWNFFGQRGITKQAFWVPYQSNTARFLAAIDAVRTPTGSIGCRVNNDAITTNDMPDCVPYNLFGTNVLSQEAFDWTQDGPRLSQTVGQNVFGAAITGEPFQLFPAGPVSVALSAEFRKDTIRGFNDAVSATFGWFSTQMTGFNASQNVKEGALEVLVPVLSDVEWARSLDVNAAVRATDYSVAGFETTWKIGATYQMTDELRFRLTQSRDIRAPNLQDLFSPPIGNNNTTPDPFRGNVSSQYRQITRGNTSLSSERANTTGIGVVYQPAWLDGLSMSADYYRIKNNGAVASPSFAYVLQQCFVGVQAYCAQVTRFPVPDGSPAGTIGVLQSIATGPQNQASVLAKGVDYEVSYRAQLSDWVDSWDGSVAIRVVATNVMDRITDSGIAGPTQFLNGAGVGSSPRWGINTQVTYSLDRARITYVHRYLTHSLQNNTLLACLTNCPTISGFQTVDYNELPSYSLSNLTATYRFYEDGDNNAEAFFNVDNLFDRDPPVAPNQIAGATYGLATLPHFDTLGRRFRVGVRFQM